MRIKILWVLVVWLSGGSILCAESPRMNVLFIISDDLTATALSCYENKACKTPNIDRLASEGVRYTRTYCQFPVCGPSRASFMSGYYPHATGTFGYVSGRKNIGDRATWSQHFIDNGYYVARVSKIYHMGVPIDIERGSNGSDDERSWTERFNSQGPEWKAPGDSELLENNPDGSKPVKGGNTLELVKAEGGDLVHSDGKTAQKACELLRKHKDEPFFLAVGFVRPHVPFVAPGSYFEPYDWNNMVLPEKVDGDWDDIPKAGINYKTSKNLNLNTEQEQKGVAAYYASVAFMDAQVGKVLDTLREEGLEDNTIVIFTSDHGFHLCEHDFWMKVGLMEESARVPLIIKVPGKQPAVCDSFTELIDLYPTVAELCGLEVPDRLQGKSLVKTLDDPSVAVRDAAFCVNYKSYLLRTEKWAFIQHGKEGELGLQLFDMKRDPKQFTNLAGDPEYAAVVATFKKRLAEKLAEVGRNDLHRTPPVILDCSDAPALEPWGKEGVRLIKEWYPQMVDLLYSEGYRPPENIQLKINNPGKGVAATAGNKIFVAASWIAKEPGHGYLIHELVHVVQDYRGGGVGWLTEGIADYIRWGLYEEKPQAWFPVPRADQDYRQGYQVAAGFLLWLENSRSPGMVKKLNAASREKRYSDDLFKKETGMALDELWAEYKTGREKK